MSAVSASVLALLDALSASIELTPDSWLDVHDGRVTDSDQNTKTISARLPYVVYLDASAEPVNQRMGGLSDRAYDVKVTCVGSTQQQADWAASRVEAALDGARVLTRAGGRPRQMLLDERRGAVQDADWNRPDGGPLFSVALRFAV